MPDPTVHLDGELVPLEEACLPPTDRGHLYGDGVFETVRAYGGHIFRLGDHLERLRRSAGTIALGVPWGDDELAKALHETLDANGRADGMARLTVTRGDGWGLEVPEDQARLVVVTRPAPERPDPRKLDLQEGLPPLPTAKTCNRLPHVTARMRARARGYDDAVFVDDDRLIEATAANLFLVEREELVTPPSPPALPGVTRSVVLRIADRLHLTVREEPIRRDRATGADDAFVTSTGLEVHPVAKLGSRRFPDRAKVTERLMRAFPGQVEEDRRGEDV